MDTPHFEGDEPKGNSDQSYQQFSSEQILVQFGQLQSDLIGSVINDNNKISGKFGMADIFQNHQDKLILLNTHTQALTLATKIYRGITVRTNKKRQVKINPQMNKDQNEKEKDSQQNMFQSSQSQPKRQPKKRKRGQDKQQPSRMRIIRKLRALSKRKP